MTRHVFMDETRARGYVTAAVTVSDPEAARKVIRQLVRPGNRRLHMVDERPHRRPDIIAEITALPLSATIYDAGRRHRTDREARKACLDALIMNLTSEDAHIRLVLKEDKTLVQFDQQRLIEAVRRSGLRGLLLYEHAPAHMEPLLALPDVLTWCWVRAGLWRRTTAPVLADVRRV